MIPVALDEVLAHHLRVAEIAVLDLGGERRRKELERTISRTCPV
jgi:hypothetical protein